MPTPNVYYSRPNIRIGNIPSCSGQPSAGTLIPAGTVAACPLTAFTLTAVNYSIASNMRFRWKQSTDGGLTWMPAAGGSGDTTFQYITPPLSTDSISYHMVGTCPASGKQDSTANITYKITQPVYAPLPFSESFEGWASRCDTAEVPSIHWTNAPYTGNSSWRRHDSGTKAGWTAPASGAYSPAAKAGLHSARFHAHAAATGNARSGNLSAYIDCSTGAGNKDLWFYLRTDSGKIQPADSLFIDLSTNAGAAFSTIAAYGPGTGSWDLQHIVLASDSPKTVIRFRAFSKYAGYTDIGLDSVVVAPVPPPAGMINPNYPGFSIAPNPVRGTVTINSHTGGTVVITDIVGREVQHINLPSGGGRMSIDLTAMPPGLYTYRYIADGIQRMVGKLLIAQ